MLDIRNPRSLGPAREAAGLTAVALAEKAGINRMTIARLESGATSWRLETFKRVEKALAEAAA